MANSNVRKHWFRGVFSDAVGVRGRKNLTAWVVAGSLAYFFYVVPEQKRAKEQHEARELSRKLAAEQGWPDRTKMRPIPDPQTNGLIVGKGKG